jgi:hypothetical protein
MGKRSNFKRRERDFYPTPYAAVLPLIPHLRGVRAFAEPCCGDGALIRHLESFGLRCTYAGDISTGQDALALDHYGAADALVTNPPFTRKLMHRLIEHFQCIAPTWLLMELDWEATQQAVPFLPHCSDIVVIGRVKWFAESKHTSKENFDWYRFHAAHKSGPVFHGHGAGVQTTPPRTTICERCRKRYGIERSTSRFCPALCRQRAHRYLSGLSVTVSVTTPCEVAS